MPGTPKKSGAQAFPVELSLQHLRNCLVNLPSELTSVLVNANTIAQNVVVELSYRQQFLPTTPSKQDGKPSQKSIYVGWTGLDSRANNTRQAKPTPVLEIDTTFAKTLGLVDGQKVGVLLHQNSSEAHTVHIEPVTETDWEIIELHANFLEINLLAQIRALPNPYFKSPSGSVGHPLTLHVSPTSTANILVTALEPKPSTTSAFVKISPDGEVIVAPKARKESSTNFDERTPRSTDGKSSTSTVKTKTTRAVSNRHVMFLRGVRRGIASQYFDESADVEQDSGVKVWLDWSLLVADQMRSVTHVLVSIIHPAGLRAQTDSQHEPDPNPVMEPSSTIVARICPWEDAPDKKHIALSSDLCAMLQLPHAVGETIKIEPAPPAIPKASIRALKVFPFPRSGFEEKGLQFGGTTNSAREKAGRELLSLYGETLLQSPLTDGMILPRSTSANGTVWPGGVLKFDPAPTTFMDKTKSSRGWFLGSEKNLSVRAASDSPAPSSSSRALLEVATETTKSDVSASIWSVGESLPLVVPSLVGIDRLIVQLQSHIKHASSILLTGAHGSGKTSLCQILAHHCQGELYHTSYFPCRSLVTDETRVSKIKEDLERVFGLATWNARNGGRSLVILDDVDKLCPVETELEVGNDNSRSRHVSELLVSAARHYCYRDSGVILLATAKGKEEVNNVVIGGHVVRDIVHISSPDKETRRTILEALAVNATDNVGQARIDDMAMVNGNGNAHEEDTGPTPKQAPIQVDPAIDFLEIAGRTDGYMPGDLKLLLSRARSEALIRAASATLPLSDTMQLTLADFTSALKGFTPSSLLNVTLQHSSTTFASIGGLQGTRKILLETLQYPTLYAPIFAQCPLRLRSGLLLYGYPGCGKTLLASAVAGECGLNFISVKGPEILNKYIGASEKSVRDLFDRAQAARPCVLFFDEFDSVAPKRGHDSTGVTDRVVNQLLTQMDGAEGLSGVYVLAATSRPDLIDPALLRPGRLDKSLLCDMPQFEDRLEILQAVSSKLKISPSLLAPGDGAQANGVNGTHDDDSRDLIEVARRTEGFSGADLQALVYNAHLEAIHDVLGDRNDNSNAHKAPKAETDGMQDPNTDFTYFRLSDSAETNSKPSSAAVRASERAKIATQLAAYRKAQKSNELGDFGHNQKKEKKTSKEPVIEWQHIQRSLAQTRPSINAVERERFRRIYREFVVGRSGDMKDGQGGSGIGGRTSLM